MMHLLSRTSFLFVWFIISIISRASSQSCTTSDDTSDSALPNTPCKFPFVYRDEVMNGCTPDKKGLYWCSTKVEAGSNKHVKGNWGFCPSYCDRSCAGNKICKPIKDCKKVKSLLQKYKGLTRNDPQKPSLRQELKSLVCNNKPKKVCCDPFNITTTTPTTKIPTTTTIKITTTTTTIYTPQDQSSGKKKSRFPSSCQEEPVTNFKGNKLPRIGRCGKSCNTDTKVVNGEQAQLGEFPWAALLGYQAARKAYDYRVQKRIIEKYVRYKCGGTLINTWYVLTAAHCHQESPRHKKVYEVVLGEWQLPEKGFLNGRNPDCPPDDEEKTQCLPKVQKISVDKVIIHRGYTRLASGIFNDIALIRLKKEAILNDGVQLACLPLFPIKMAKQIGVGDFVDGLADYEGTVIGWGHTKNLDGGDFDTANVAKSILQKGKVPIWSTSTCQSKEAPNSITQNHLCAGGQVDGPDSCRGDSGGGLFIKKNTSNLVERQEYGYVQVGVVSYGSSDCGSGSPGIYTRVSQFIQWIKENLEP